MKIKDAFHLVFITSMLLVSLLSLVVSLVVAITK